MDDRFDVIVIGVGSMGAAACYELVRRDPSLRVLGIEQFGIPHDRGSHHGVCRAFRTAYFEHPDYVALLRRSLALWRDIEAETQATLLHLTGGLYIGRPDCALVRDSISAAEWHDLPHSMLQHDELAARYPQFRVDEEMIGFFEEQAGYVRCETAVAAYARAGRKRGAELHESEAVRSWKAGSSSVTVRTDRATYEADQLIITAGPWTSRVVRHLGIELSVTRQAAAWFEPRNAELFAADRFPVWGLDVQRDGGASGIMYGFPLMGEKPGFKIAHHWPGDACDVKSVDRSNRPEDEALFRATMRRHLPQAEGELLAMQTCLYTISPDGHFIIDRHPEASMHGRVTIACGFSGHGFKFVPVMGKALAELAVEGRSSEAIGFLGLGRFG
jgi:sarcosine oxidase